LPAMSERLSSGALNEAQGPWDIVINATSSSLSGAAPVLDDGVYGIGSLAYDMVYGAEPTPFMRQAQESGAAQCADGLGMLVGQAAASFEIWQGMLPDTEPVLNALRNELRAG